MRGLDDKSEVCAAVTYPFLFIQPQAMIMRLAQSYPEYAEMVRAPDFQYMKTVDDLKRLLSEETRRGA